MDDEIKKLVIIDYVEHPELRPVEVSKSLPELSGYDLDTIEKARQWLTDPRNWFRSELFILKWDGLIPKISERHGRRLIAEPWDDGLPWCVVYGQNQRRMKKVDDDLEPKEIPSDE